MTPTPLRDRLLFLEARLAMAEDKIDDLRARIRHALRTFWLAVELFTFMVVVRWLDRHFSSRGTR
jgi:hypothetical protein